MKLKFIVCAALLYSVNMFAQYLIIKGKILDFTNKQALPSANAVVKFIPGDKITGTASDNDGNFSIEKTASRQIQSYH